MISLQKIILILFFLSSIPAMSQEKFSDRKKIRYLKKIERKNERFAKKQEKKTHKLLSKLSKEEKTLYEGVDSVELYSLTSKESFQKIEERFSEKQVDTKTLLNNPSYSITIHPSLSSSTIAENLDGDIKDYLHQQLLTTSFISDSTNGKLKAQADKTKENITKTAEKLNRLKSIQQDIKKHQQTLKNYGVNTPELKSKLKGIDKTCYYYNQGMNGFKDLYTNPAKGIESSMLKKLSFSKDFKLFQTQFNSLPFSASQMSSGILTGTTPDMSGYQTKTQVRAMLPQNAQGISAEAKSQLVANMQNSLTRFTELRKEKPDVSMFKEKPDFKINPYKGLPLRKRLVPAFTFQPQIKKYNEPFTVDAGATLGFKLVERVTPLIGLSTKIGLGKDIQHLAFSYQGIVARAGFDTKLCYGFSFQIWYEATWKPLPAIRPEINASHYPEPSFIAGICNTYRISRKVKGTLMIGYDFFYNKHTPYTSPWVIRMGWQ